jgi:hypothetical protein
MEESTKDRTRFVYSQVTTQLAGQDVRELWYKLESELTRQGGGPDACFVHLETELKAMSEQVRRALDLVDKSQEAA